MAGGGLYGRESSSEAGLGARALEFGHAHPLESPGYTATMVRLEERLGRADMLATQQRDGILAVRAATLHKQELMGKSGGRT